MALVREEQIAAMREQLPGHPLLFDVDKDFPALIAAARAQMREQWGGDVDSPAPAVAARGRGVHPPPAVVDHAGGARKADSGGRGDTTRGIHG